jgi:signal transduction histidine kinase
VDFSTDGDAGALRRMLVDLLDNAREHTLQESIELECREELDTVGRWIGFYIRHTGEGIAQELADRLGRAFAMNAGVLGINLIGGSGLGLAICNGIAVAHGGRILIESAFGSGTRVTVRVRADLTGPAETSGDTSIKTIIT